MMISAANKRGVSLCVTAASKSRIILQSNALMCVSPLGNVLPTGEAASTSERGAYRQLRAIFNPDVLRIEASRPPYDYVAELAAPALTHTHPGGLLQMVAAQRVVQVKTDNITVRQAEVFAHCSCSCGGKLRGKRTGS